MGSALMGTCPSSDCGRGECGRGECCRSGKPALKLSTDPVLVRGRSWSWRGRPALLPLLLLLSMDERGLSSSLLQSSKVPELLNTTKEGIPISFERLLDLIGECGSKHS
mmetsp:Transcript_117103/g.283962  ORF Transcript_117103/g.283962 Transcript_117103/m.283962 type:complete len:109 (-) Transcript_117103:1187-1513(-)